MRLSLSVSTARDVYWRRLCESLAGNAVDFEVIFVGPLGAGIERLSVPARFIDVPVSVPPPRCWEIGARAALGELLAFGCDDFVFSPGFLDAVAAEAAKSHHRFDMFTARYIDNGVDSLEHQRIRGGGPDMPLLPLGGFAFTEAHHAIGGIDRRFRYAFWDVDLYMSMCEAGGRTTLIEGHECHEQDNFKHALSERPVRQADEELLGAMWPHPVHPGMRRALPRERWEDWEAIRAAV